MSTRALTGLLLAALFVAGCSGSDGETASQAVDDAGRIEISLAVTDPESGAEIASPVKVGGTIEGAEGLNVAAVVYERDEDGDLSWRGNARLEVDDGKYSGEVAYTLESEAQGLIEVMVVSPTSGTVLASQSVPVELDSSP